MKLGAAAEKGKRLHFFFLFIVFTVAHVKPTHLSRIFTDSFARLSESELRGHLFPLGTSGLKGGKDGDRQV